MNGVAATFLVSSVAFLSLFTVYFLGWPVFLVIGLCAALSYVIGLVQGANE